MADRPSPSPPPEVGDDDDGGGGSSAMAAAMGFSGFGGPSKKRKFNSRADQAFVARPAAAQKKVSTSANSVPLQQRRQQQQPKAVVQAHSPTVATPAALPQKPPSPMTWGEPPANAAAAAAPAVQARRQPMSLPPPAHARPDGNSDEIDLDVDEEARGGVALKPEGGAESEEGGEGGEKKKKKKKKEEEGAAPPRSPSGEDAGYATDPDPEPQYVDTSRPARQEELPDPPMFSEAEALEMQAKIDAILKSRGEGGGPGAGEEEGGGGGGGSAGGVEWTAMSARPSLPPPPTDAIRTTGRAQWWHDYYDPRFNQNPWEWLERARNLPTVGVWLARESG